MKLWKNKLEDFFKWVKGTKLVELDSINVEEDPVRPELDLEFRKSYGRKMYGLKFDNEIEGIIKKIEKPPMIEKTTPILPIITWRHFAKKQKMGYPGKCG